MQITTITYLFIAASFFCSCGKMEQREETSFTCVVEDATTGTMTEKAGVYLYEYQTNARPFSPLSRTLVEYFEVDYGEPFSYEFNAKRGQLYDYVLEFDNLKGSFYSGSSDPSTFESFYETNQECTLSRKQYNKCELKIEPTANVIFDANNPLDLEAQSTDSLYWILSDGTAFYQYACKGIGGCPVRVGEVPHGNYDWHYQVYRDGVLEEDVQKQVYIRHNSDTTLWVWF